MFSGQECGGLGARIRLRYIDQVELRQAIEKQLNRVELANSFTRAHRCRKSTRSRACREEQEIAESCNRLIKNCIICWNYLYLTRQVETARTPEEHNRLLRMISVHSPSHGRISTCSGSTTSPTRGRRTTPVSCPQNLCSESSRTTGSRQIGETQAIAAQNENPCGLSGPMCV